MKFTCIDSFCGAGGLGLGLKRSGMDILLSFDIDPTCIKTINTNKKYFNHPAQVADILQKYAMGIRPAGNFTGGLYKRGVI